LVRRLCYILKRYVYGEEAVEVSSLDEKKVDQEVSIFCAEVKSILDIYPGIIRKNGKNELHKYGLDSNFPTGGLLMTDAENCRKCHKKLVLDKKTHPVIIYHLTEGSMIGCRGTKFCRSCKIYEHYGYWTTNGEKHHEVNSIQYDILLSSEETAFDMSMMREMSALLIAGAVPFSTYATAYNKRFGYKKVPNVVDNVKRYVHYK